MIPSAPAQLLPPSAVPDLPHMRIAFGEIGVLEDTRPGKSNARIEQYGALTAGGAAPDDVPWCAEYLGWCLEMAGIRSTRSKMAASYASFGEPGSFAYGDIVFLGKTDPDAGGSGHVCFLLGVSGDDIYVIGGNQGNRVSIATRKKANVTACRRIPKPKAA